MFLKEYSFEGWLCSHCAAGLSLCCANTDKDISFVHHCLLCVVQNTFL